MDINHQMNLNIICDLKLLKLQIVMRLEVSSSPLPEPKPFFPLVWFLKAVIKKKKYIVWTQTKCECRLDWWEYLALSASSWERRNAELFYKEGIKTLTQYQEAKVSNMLLALLMLCVILNNPWWQVNSFKLEELISPDLGK